MAERKREKPSPKASMHPRNKHHGPYDFEALVKCCPALAPMVGINKYGQTSIDFSDSEAVLMLNKALLKYHYDISEWDIPPGFLCPPVPGRADYVHHVADILSMSNRKRVPKGQHIRCLDIGVGANCIYPIIGCKEYDWSFVGVDVQHEAIEAAQDIIHKNDTLAGQVQLRRQTDEERILKGIIKPEDRFDITMSNPPFHASAEEAKSGTLRKLSNLKGKRVKDISLNFGGQPKELIYDGGEQRFIQKMIVESRQHSKQCYWYSTLVAKEAHLKKIYKTLKGVEAEEVKTLVMSQGNKTSRIVAWTFLNGEQQGKWVEEHWRGNKSFKDKNPK